MDSPSLPFSPSTDWTITKSARGTHRTRRTAPVSLLPLSAFPELPDFTTVNEEQLNFWIRDVGVRCGKKSRVIRAEKEILARKLWGNVHGIEIEDYGVLHGKAVPLAEIQRQQEAQQAAKAAEAAAIEAELARRSAAMQAKQQVPRVSAVQVHGQPPRTSSYTPPPKGSPSTPYSTAGLFPFLEAHQAAVAGLHTQFMNTAGQPQLYSIAGIGGPPSTLHCPAPMLDLYTFLRNSNIIQPQHQGYSTPVSMNSLDSSQNTYYPVLGNMPNPQRLCYPPTSTQQPFLYPQFPPLESPGTERGIQYQNPSFPASSMLGRTVEAFNWNKPLSEFSNTDSDSNASIPTNLQQQSSLHSPNNTLPGLSTPASVTVPLHSKPETLGPMAARSSKPLLHSESLSVTSDLIAGKASTLESDNTHQLHLSESHNTFSYSQFLQDSLNLPGLSVPATYSSFTPSLTPTSLQSHASLSGTASVSSGITNSTTVSPLPAKGSLPPTA